MVDLAKGYSIANQVYGGYQSAKNIINQFGPKEKIGERKSINSFMAEQLGHDLARKAHFRIKIAPPPTMLNKYTPHEVNDKISMMASGIFIPDRTIDVIQKVMPNMADFNIANDLNYNVVTINFYCNTEMFQRTFMEDWINLVHPYNDGDGQPGYYDDYTGTTEIYQLKHSFVDDMGIPPEKDWTYKTTLHECYPSKLFEIDYAWDSNEFIKFGMTMIFRYLETDTEHKSHGNAKG